MLKFDVLVPTPGLSALFLWALLAWLDWAPFPVRLQ